MGEALERATKVFEFVPIRILNRGVTNVPLLQKLHEAH